MTPIVTSGGVVVGRRRVIQVRRARSREGHDAAKRVASDQSQQFGAMVAPVTDEQRPIAFECRDVAVTTAEFGGRVNDHGGVSKARMTVSSEGPA